MKKTLFTLGAFALVVLGFAACGNSDCTCKITYGDEGALLGTVPVTDFDGDCDEVTWTDLGNDAAGDAWANVIEELENAKLTCEED